jgi:hypothetical protein
MIVQYSSTETKKICDKYQVTNHDWIFNAGQMSILKRTLIHSGTLDPQKIIDTKCSTFLDIQFKEVDWYYYRKISINSFSNKREDPWGRIFPVYPNSASVINNLDASWIVSKDDYYTYRVNPDRIAYVYATTLERHRIFCLELLF